MKLDSTVCIRLFLLWIVVCLNMVGDLWAADLKDTAMTDMPKLDRIEIDGQDSDWGRRGFEVGLMDWNGKLRPAAKFDSRLRLGWDDRGLLLLVRVSADTLAEAESPEDFYRYDSVEIFVKAPASVNGETDSYRVIISPGVTAGNTEPRHSFGAKDNRTQAVRSNPLQVSIGRTKLEKGYQLEVLLPWRNLSRVPTLGDQIGLQVVVNHSPDGRYTTRFAPRWSSNPTNNSGLRLSEQSSPPILALASCDYPQFSRMEVNVQGAVELIGQAVSLQAGGATLAQGKFEADPVQGRAKVQLAAPMPAPNKPYGKLTITSEAQSLATIEAPDADAARGRAMMLQTPTFASYVFTGVKFPECSFEDLKLVENLIGSYQLRPRFFNSRYEPVQQADQPGRYGAVVEIMPKEGMTLRRYITLYRLPDNAKPTEQDKSSLAIQMAAEGELKPGIPIDKYNNPAVADRQWWLGLERKLQGLDPLAGKQLNRPTLIEGAPARELRQGSLEQAGMSPQAVARIDALCREWAQQSDEAFSLCIARHGVIVLHQAYGQRGGKPLTTNDPSWIASLTKVLSGSVLMMLVDQGLLDLDDPVARYIPALRQQVSTPMTVRMLFNHTAGFAGNFNLGRGQQVDLGHRLASFYRHMPIGRHHEYHGTDVSLAQSILELVSNQTLASMYKDHLMEPMGLSIQVSDMQGDAVATALDVAKFGQMLLNGGAYGKYRFFSAQSLQRMMPESVVKYLPADSGVSPKILWGMGTTPQDTELLGEGTFGHGSASESILRVSPRHDLVVVMVRNAPGRNFGKYKPLFIQAVAEGLAEAR